MHWREKASGVFLTCEYVLWSCYVMPGVAVYKVVVLVVVVASGRAQATNYQGAWRVKIIHLPGAQINDPINGKQYSLLFLAATSLPWSLKVANLWELTRCPSRALILGLWVASRTSNKQGHCLLCHTSCEGPRIRSITNITNLDCQGPASFCPPPLRPPWVVS